jgi:hypothetical protein
MIAQFMQAGYKLTAEYDFCLYQDFLELAPARTHG